MKRRRLDTGKENFYSLYDTILSAHWVRRCSGKVSDGTGREVEMSAQKILAYHLRKAMNCWLRTNGRWFYGLFSVFFSDWNVLLYLWSHVPGTGSETIWVYILYVLLVSHILTFLHMVKTMHILNRHFGISEFEIVWYVYPRGVPIVDVPIFFLYPRILSDCTCPTLSAVHVPMIVSCNKKNMAILFFTRQFNFTTPFFNECEKNISIIFHSLWLFVEFL